VGRADRRQRAAPEPRLRRKHRGDHAGQLARRLGMADVLQRSAGRIRIPREPQRASDALLGNGRGLRDGNRLPSDRELSEHRSALRDERGLPRRAQSLHEHAAAELRRDGPGGGTPLPPYRGRQLAHRLRGRPGLRRGLRPVQRPGRRERGTGQAQRSPAAPGRRRRFATRPLLPCRPGLDPRRLPHGPGHRRPERAVRRSDRRQRPSDQAQWPAGPGWRDRPVLPDGRREVDLSGGPGDGRCARDLRRAARRQCRTGEAPRSDRKPGRRRLDGSVQRRHTSDLQDLRRAGANGHLQRSARRQCRADPTDSDTERRRFARTLCLFRRSDGGVPVHSGRSAVLSVLRGWTEAATPSRLSRRPRSRGWTSSPC